ncbi:DUF6503 family protein [Aquimarina sp. 2-A2]|uniref:DUF6503 family protein n=1 Tax=Aquimarina sp. 2-A2 TaxID=3382644 RepID=UPI00387F357C
MIKKITLILIAVAITSCNTSKKEETKDESATQEMMPVEPDGGIGDGAVSISDNYVSAIETAHKKNEFIDNKMVSFNVSLVFGGQERLDAKVTMLTNSSKIRIDKKDGSKLIFDGSDVYLCPMDANDKGARFDMFTWTYFFGLPYKLSDEGANIVMADDKSLDDKIHSTAKMTFEPGTGDAPDDWYVLYKDNESNLLKAAAYIVTFGNKEGEEKKPEPHAIQYKDYQMVDGIPVAMQWEFNNWSAANGMAEKLGEATISDVTFMEEESDLFATPENAKKITM